MNRSSTAATVLAADVGGTHVRFALVDVAADEPVVPGSTMRYRADDFAGFAETVQRYLDETGARPARAVVAAAGPRADGDVRLTNRPWTIARGELKARFGFESVALINDFAAMGLCIPLLRTDDLCDIGAPPRNALDPARSQSFAIIGPGTGLGVGALLIRDGRMIALETEGGHTSFAPGNEEEVEILRRLAARFGRVSNERVLCGSGLANLHGVLCEMAGTPAQILTPEEITQRAHSDPMCRRAIERFRELLGAVAGDFVLSFGAWDGVYITGGLAPHLAPWLREGGFRRRFEDKGRFSEALARVPTSVVLHRDPGLLGAVAFALVEAGSASAQFSR